MKLWALSDLHVGHSGNLAALEAIPDHGDDWLIVAGDVGERLAQLEVTWQVLGKRFARLLWVPGNHELWAYGKTGFDAAPAPAKYDAMVDLCRAYSVLTPEDPWPVWPGEGPFTVIALLCLLYDYSFAPEGFTPEQAVAWAREDGIVCRDEDAIDPSPWPSRQAWCAARVAAARARLDALPAAAATVLVNHWPLRADLVRLYRIPRFAPWCGTRATEDWHLRYRARVVVSGHLHMRATDWRDGARFEEASLGYPRHWKAERGAAAYLREILPGPAAPESGFGGPLWIR